MRKNGKVYLSSQIVVYRDIKQANILHNNNEVVKLESEVQDVLLEGFLLDKRRSRPTFESCSLGIELCYWEAPT